MRSFIVLNLQLVSSARMVLIFHTDYLHRDRILRLFITHFQIRVTRSYYSRDSSKRIKFNFDRIDILFVVCIGQVVHLISLLIEFRDFYPAVIHYWIEWDW